LRDAADGDAVQVGGKGTDGRGIPLAKTGFCEWNILVSGHVYALRHARVVVIVAVMEKVFTVSIKTVMDLPIYERHDSLEIFDVYR
jgi:hypothetical protein